MKFSVRFDLKARNKSSEAKHIRLRVSWAGNRVEMFTGHKVPEKYWNGDNMRVLSQYRSPKYTGAAINNELSAIETYVRDMFSKYHLQTKTPTPKEVQDELKVYFGKGKVSTSTMTLFDCMDLFAETMSEQNGWAKGTTVKINTIKKHLQDISPKLDFSDLDEQGLMLFLKSLMKKGMRNTTIAKDIDILRWFLRWAVKHGYSENRDFEAFRPKLKGTDGNSKEIIYLEWDELIKLFDFDFGENHPGLAAVRDVFCFCCFTGLRYSDVAKLRVSDIKDGYISVVTQKTTDGIRIELNDFSRAILEKYGPRKKELNKKALPVISNQRMNDYLKIIGKMLGFDTPIRIVYFKGSTRYEDVIPKYELLTTHCARRTFVVNALRLGIPAEVIMKWTGHSDFKSMKPYVKIVDELKEREMSKFNLLNSSPEIPRK